MTEALYWTTHEKEYVHCTLCPHTCALPPGGRGLCGVRENRHGTLYTQNYLRVCAQASDPIEKKPLYHFFPGSQIISLGTYGCNFSCDFCQNYHLSQAFSPETFITKGITRDTLLAALPPSPSKADLQTMCGVAYTYSEPMVWAETVLHLAPAVRDAGYKNVLVTNGYVNAQPRADLLAVTDAWNIDLKAYDDAFYRTYCSGRLAPVLETIAAAVEHVHLELTTLIIPGLNDSVEQITALREGIIAVAGTETPVHISRYFPQYKLLRSPTPMETMQRSYAILREKLSYVYIGNCGEEAHTACAACGTTVITRVGYKTSLTGMRDDGTCRVCGHAVVCVT